MNTKLIEHPEQREEPLFEPFLPLDEVRADLPAFPTAELPAPLNRYVTGAAKARQVPEDYVATNTLGVLGLASQDSYRVYLQDGWDAEGLNLYVMSAMESGTNKSSTLDMQMEPIRDYEAQLRIEHQPIVNQDEVERLEADAIKSNTQKTLKGGKVDDREELRESMTQAVDRLSEKPVYLPELFTNYATPEAIGVLLYQQGGRLGVVTSEGDEVISYNTGRYGDSKPNLSFLLDGWDGRDCRIGRKNSPSYTIKSPCLSFVLATQPRTLQGLSKRSGDLKERGAMGRFLYCLPNASPGDMKLIRDSGLSKQLQSEYHQLVTTLLALPKAAPGKWPLLRLSSESYERFGVLYARVAEDMKKGGRLCHMTSWASKSRSHCLRIAGLLHLVKWVHNGCIGELEEIDAETISSAIRIIEYYTQHAMAVWTIAALTPDSLSALRLLDYAMKGASDDGCFKRISKRDLHQLAKNCEEFANAKRLEAPLVTLKEFGYLSIIEYEKDGPGRPKSPMIVLNPKAVAAWERCNL